VRSESDNPERFKTGSALISDDGATLIVEAVSQSDAGMLLVRFEEVSDRAAAEALRGTNLWIEERSRRPLRPGEYWPEDLAGCAVVSPDGTSLGTVRNLIEGAAQDRLVIANPRGVFEVPFVAALVREVDLDSRTIVVDAIEGLIDGP
jgi:16S rRNA processing protein RimM